MSDLKLYSDLVLYKTYANLKRDTDKMYLGCFWWLLEPLINTAVMYFTLTLIGKNLLGNAWSFIFIGTVVYGHISACINSGANSIVSNSGLLPYYNLPKTLYPIISILNLSWKFLFSFIVIIPLLWILKSPITVCYLALPILLACQVFVGISISLPLCILLPYFQDGKTVLTTALSVLMWLSGVFYTSRDVTIHAPNFIHLFNLNPAVVLIEAQRDVLLYGKWPQWERFLFPGLICIASFLIGIYLIDKFEKKVTKIPM